MDSTITTAEASTDRRISAEADLRRAAFIAQGEVLHLLEYAVDRLEECEAVHHVGCEVSHREPAIKAVILTTARQDDDRSAKGSGTKFRVRWATT